ncbi:hypothetical protein [Bacillus ndiopicus]|uniref:hypothetical protein n=1 Tax=Bacillus ndiopicus TaxID=1347368 RepID=UPI0005A81311|nr:hypothetical protein [Bacillus ndiopicus]
MFKAAVYLVQGLIFILVTLIGLGPIFSIAAPDSDEIYGVWVSMNVSFNTLVLISAFVQLRIKKFGCF